MREQFLGAVSALLGIVMLAGAQTPGKGTARGTTLETIGVSWTSRGAINIEITTKDESAPGVETLADPARIVVDLPNTGLETDLGPIPIRTSGVKDVRIGTDAAKTTRVVVDLARLCRYELVHGSGHKLILKLDPTSPASVAEARAYRSQSPPANSAPEKVMTASATNLAEPAAPPANTVVQASFSAEAAVIFKQRCTACHTYGKGIKVGPDLKGVTERRKREWLVKFIHASSQVIKSGDPTAASLFAQFKQQRMPDWTDLSEKQISDILDYLAVGGPDIKPEDERNAETATARETDAGRKLFYGETRLQHGAPACASCHSVAGAGMRGGTLGPDLTDVYFRYQDVALTGFLRHPCFAWAATNTDPYLTPRESFALKAFLRLVETKTPTRAATVESSSTSGGIRR